MERLISRATDRRTGPVVLSVGVLGTRAVDERLYGEEILAPRGRKEYRVRVKHKWDVRSPVDHSFHGRCKVSKQLVKLRFEHV